MKKQAITLIVVLVLLIGAVTTYVLLSREEPVAEESSAADLIQVLGGIPQPFVKEITVQNDVDTFTVRNGNENAIQQQNAAAPNFTIDGMDNETVTTAMLTSVMNTAANLTAKKHIAGADADLSLYGLADPQATVTITYDSSVASLLIGDSAPGGEGNYVKVGDNVYLVASASLNNYLGSRLNFAAKSITGGDPQTVMFTKVTFSGQRFPEPVVLEKAPEDDKASSMMGMSSYLLTSPIVTAADSTNGVTPLTAVFALGADAVVGMAADSSQYGLQSPYVTLDVVTEDPELGSFSLSFSAPDADGNVYISRSGSPYIYQKAAAGLPWLTMTLFDLQEKMIILPFIDTIASVDVMGPDGVTHTFRLNGEGDDLTATADGKEITADNFRQFYQTLIAARFDEEVTTESASSDAAEMDAAASAEALGDASASDTAPSEAASLVIPSPEVSSSAADDEAAASAEAAEASDSEAVSEDPASPEADTAAIVGDSDVYLQFTYHYRDDKPADTVRFARSSARRYLVWLNEGKKYYIQSLYIDRVIADLPKVLAGEDVKSYY